MIMKKLTLLLLLFLASVASADVVRPTLSRALADALYCKLTGCTMTGAMTLASGSTVKLGSGTASGTISGVYAKMVSATGVGNTAATSDDPLWTLTPIPANTLTANGEAIVLTLVFLTGATGNNKRWGITVGGTQVNTSNTTGNGLPFVQFMIISRVDATHVNVFIGSLAGSSVNLLVADLTANALALVVTGASPTTGAANDVKLMTGIAEIKR
jgi:hypothetical protein